MNYCQLRTLENQHFGSGASKKLFGNQTFSDSHDLNDNNNIIKELEV
jgi:hypothetical protein